MTFTDSLPLRGHLLMDSDDEFDDVPQAGHPASNAQERRRTQKAIFEAWLASDAGEQALKPKVRDGKAKGPTDAELSIHSLLNKEKHAIIKNPRDYQLELFERAKKENTIAVLDTGSGKTLIAVLLLRHTIDQELEYRAAGRPPRISFFLVSSVTLVYQQFSVLDTNLDHTVARVCGADNTDNWHKSKFEKLFSDNRVIVCTAEILYQCLFRGYITMKGINLLIFDEAHHAKNNHSYARQVGSRLAFKLSYNCTKHSVAHCHIRIIKDFYLTQDDVKLRPRIFGMTASPIDAKTDVMLAASELESLLNSRIATTEDMNLTNAVKRPDERILRYNSLCQPYETKLLQTFKAQHGHIDIFHETLEKCPLIAQGLGPWCADQYLVGALAEKRLKKYEGKTEQKFYSRSVQNDVKELDRKQADLRSAIEFAEQERVNLDKAGISETDISSKVHRLQEYLANQFERPTSQRCIVFVEQRHTARLLDSLFRRIGTQHMKSAFLVGNSGKDDEDNFSFRQQVMTLIKFRQGELNCLFATSVAEEGLDVPDCNLVIRFDMYRTMIQYVQSRGRARQQNSKFIHFLETGNALQEQLVSEVRFQERAMRKFCQSLPEDRRLVGQDDTLEVLMEKEKYLRVYIDPASKAKLTYGNALAVLADYVAVLPNDTNEILYPTYVVQSHGSKFISEVLLPPGAAKSSFLGSIHTKKTLAKRSAAFEACIELRRHNHLDENLMSTQRRRANAMRNAHLALNKNRSKQYFMQIKPSTWRDGRGTLPEELWVTLIDFPDGLDRKHSPLAILTRTRLPEFPSFPLFLSDSRESRVHSTPLQKSLQVDDGMLDKLTTFTFRVFKDVFSKKFEADGAMLSYWLAPVRGSNADNTNPGPEEILDWPLLDTVAAREDYPWTPNTPTGTLVDRFLVDKWDGGRKFFSLGIESGLRPSDPVPEGSAKSKFENTIIGYTVSLWKKAREKATWTPDQPVMKAEKLLLRLNMLAAPTEKEAGMSGSLAYLCPEPLKISVLPPALVTSCFAFPALIHRFEAYLIALEASQVVGVKCNLDFALSALTKDSDNTGEHDEQERINFQRGMGDNYERLEFIGDTFLKTATTISTFIQKPNDLEADLHVTRMLMLCNQNLLQTALKLELYQYVRSIAFSRRLWYPEGLKLLEGKGANKIEESQVIKHPLGEKTIADVCEAFIGAAYVSNDRPGEPWSEDMFDEAVRAVTKLVDREDHVMCSWNEYRTTYVMPAYQTAASTASQCDLAEKVELEHPYHFTYPRLLRSAFNHPSQPRMYEMVPNYERLEFLGDALLDMASITHLFYRFPDKDPQWLTEHKMAMVSNKFLGAVCVNIGFHKHLRYSSAIIEHQIREYATELLEAKRTADGTRDYWVGVSDPPKCLPDIVESFVGAMFIDSNFDYGVVQGFFDRNIKWYFEDMSIYDGFANNHPCTHLHNLLQTNYGCQDYRVMVKELPAVEGTEKIEVVAVVMVHDEIVSVEKGKSGRYARLRVAQQALEKIEGLAPYEFRSRYGCACSPRTADGVVEVARVADEVVGVDCGM